MISFKYKILLYIYQVYTRYSIIQLKMHAPITIRINNIRKIKCNSTKIKLKHNQMEIYCKNNDSVILSCTELYPTGLCVSAGSVSNVHYYIWYTHT